MRDPVRWEKVWEVVEEIFAPEAGRQLAAKGQIDLTLDTGQFGGRTFLEIWYKTTAATTLTVYASSDGKTWRKMREINIPGAAEESRGFFSAARYIRVTSSAPCEVEVFLSR